MSPACPIGWRPNVLAPVFYGHRDFAAADGAPASIRVYYPTTDGSPDGAPFLAGCGRYPLVLFVHGQCPLDSNPHLSWFHVPSVLARCGYVVAVPGFPGGPNPFEDADLATAQATVDWMRTAWEYRGDLADGTAAAGHSYGGIIAGLLAAAGTASAYVSLSGEWVEVAGTALDVLDQLGVPALFMWGTDPLSEADAALEHGAAPLWDKVSVPKHRLRFIDGAHFDYLVFNNQPASACVDERGPCGLVGAVAADVAALFLSRYLPPPDSGLQPGVVRVGLQRPELDLTPEQEFFAGGHLSGLQALDLHPECQPELLSDPTELRLSPATLSFGTVPVGVPRTRTLTIQNRTGHSLAVSVPPPSSPSGGFTWASAQATLSPGGTLSVPITFVKNEVGGATATFRARSGATGIRYPSKLMALAFGQVPV